LIELESQPPVPGVPELQIDQVVREPGPTTEPPKEEGAKTGRQTTRLGVGIRPGGGTGIGQGIRGITQTGLQESLTSFRPAGEIRAGTGKPRRNVWNEASLRLKDALGL
jgi:hypothetical protein